MNFSLNAVIKDSSDVLCPSIFLTCTIPKCLPTTIQVAVALPSRCRFISEGVRREIKYVNLTRTFFPFRQPVSFWVEHKSNWNAFTFSMRGCRFDCFAMNDFLTIKIEIKFRYFSWQFIIHIISFALEIVLGVPAATLSFPCIYQERYSQPHYINSHRKHVICLYLLLLLICVSMIACWKTTWDGVYQQI